MRRYGYSSAPVAHPESSAGYSGVIIPFLLTLAWGNRVFHYNQNQFPSTHQLIRGRYLKEDEDWKKTPNAFLAKRKASRFGIFCCIGPSWVSEETYAIFGASSATRNEPKGDGGFLI